jgi:hypothetical protein
VTFPDTRPPCLFVIPTDSANAPWNPSLGLEGVLQSERHDPTDDFNASHETGGDGSNR